MRGMASSALDPRFFLATSNPWTDHSLPEDEDSSGPNFGVPGGTGSYSSALSPSPAGPTLEGTQEYKDYLDTGSKLRSALQPNQVTMPRAIIGSLLSRRNPMLGSVITGDFQRQRQIQPLDLFLQVGKRLGKEKRSDDGAVEIIEPIRFIEAQALKRGLVEDEVRTRRHAPMIACRHLEFKRAAASTDEKRGDGPWREIHQLAPSPSWKLIKRGTGPALIYKTTLFRTLQLAVARAETAGVAHPLFRGIVEPHLAPFSGRHWDHHRPKMKCPTR